MKKLITLCLAVFMLAFTAGCFAEKSYTNGGLTITVPDKYADLIQVETPENDERGVLFTFTEIESLEEAEKQGQTWEGAGWLYSIGRISEEKMHELRCEDFPGYEIFAKDTDGNYYVYYHPTDVRMVRADYSDPNALAVWGELYEWGKTLRESIIAENENITAVTLSYTTLDAYIARILYKDDVEYTVSTLEYGPQEPNGIKATDYIGVLANNVVYTFAREEEAPDGEYVVLNFPNDDIRFDFFFQSGKENYIRQVWFNGEYEQLYKAEFEDESLKATEIMNDFYHEIVLHNTLGYTADDMIGTWAEKNAGRGNIEITKAMEDGKYDVKIHWSASAYQMAYWEMTAEATGNGAELRYENAKHTFLTWESEDKMTEEEIYTNGTGTFDLLSTYELVWDDQIDHSGADTVFVKAK